MGRILIDCVPTTVCVWGLTVDQGQIVQYCGDRPIETATNGLRRVGSHSRYGFGEPRLKPLVEHSGDGRRENYPPV